MKLTTILSGAVLLAGTMLAQPGPSTFGRHGPGHGERGGGRGGEMNLDALKAEIELTDQQVEQLLGIKTASREAMQPFYEQIRQKREALAQELEQENPDPATVGQLEVDITKLRKETEAKQAEFREQARNVLTPTQEPLLAKVAEASSPRQAVRQAMVVYLLDSPMGRRGGPGMWGGGRRGGRGGGRGGPAGDGPKA